MAALAGWVELVALADWAELVVSGMVAMVLVDWVEEVLELVDWVEEMADGTDSRKHCPRTCPWVRSKSPRNMSVRADTHCQLRNRYL